MFNQSKIVQCHLNDSMTPEDLKRIKAARMFLKTIRDMAEDRGINEIAKMADEALNVLPKKPRARSKNNRDKKNLPSPG